MTWDAPIDKAPSGAPEPWLTNERILSEWNRHVSKRGAKTTQRNHRVYVAAFARMFTELLTALEREDIEAFVARIGTKCSRLLMGDAPVCRVGLDVSRCPLLREGVPFESCPRYQPLDPVAVWAYICCVNRFYEWLVEEGRIARNPALPVMRDFASRHSALFDERRRKPRRRSLSKAEVRALIHGSPIAHSIAYLLMAKCYLRIHEVLKLRLDPAFCNLDEGWMDIPADWERGDKRKGNRRIILDAEALLWLRRYLEWRSHHVQRDHDGAELWDHLLISSTGAPWGKDAPHNLNTALQKNAVRLGLMTGEETERSQRINTHCFRAAATTASRARGIGHADLLLLRGDLAPGPLNATTTTCPGYPELSPPSGPSSTCDCLARHRRNSRPTNWLAARPSRPNATRRATMPFRSSAPCSCRYIRTCFAMGDRGRPGVFLGWAGVAFTRLSSRATVWTAAARGTPWASRNAM